jgi:hypothetical protein
MTNKYDIEALLIKAAPDLAAIISKLDQKDKEDKQV